MTQERTAGSMVALVTPFDQHGRVDFKVFEAIIAFQATSPTGGIIPAGTTGESPTLDHKEHREIIRVAVESAKGTGMKVLAGTGSNNTREAVELTAFAAEAGADAALIITPYYNRPSPRGVVEYFKALDAIGIPLYVYNLPRRTGINVSPETMLEIVNSCKNVVGLKAANGLLVEIAECARDCSKVRPGFEILSGDDALTVPILSIGGVGAISVIANIVPNLASEMIAAYLEGDISRAATLQQRLIPLSQACMEIQASPAGVKAIMREMGFAVGSPRSPMADVDKAELAQLMRVYEEVVG